MKILDTPLHGVGPMALVQWRSSSYPYLIKSIQGVIYNKSSCFPLADGGFEFQEYYFFKVVFQ